jgi:hypothetical protein
MWITVVSMRLVSYRVRIGRFRDVFEGNVPEDLLTKPRNKSEQPKLRSLDALLELCRCCHLIQESVVSGAVLPCEANPMWLICPCKGARKIGICAHILFVTHMTLKRDENEDMRSKKLNLKWLNEQVGLKKKSGRPKKLKACLEMESDSSDDEDGSPLALTW